MTGTSAEYMKELLIEIPVASASINGTHASSPLVTPAVEGFGETPEKVLPDHEV
jgi:hypothetical protein